MSTAEEAREALDDAVGRWVAPELLAEEIDAFRDAVAARAREEGAREATMRLKLRLEATQMTLGDLWNRVDTFDPRMAPDLEEVVKLALEPAP
jgi:hypothetical protein